jgi:hypothetical protein
MGIYLSVALCAVMLAFPAQAQWNCSSPPCSTSTIGNIWYTNGNVGIGTPSPQSPLHVSGRPVFDTYSGFMILQGNSYFNSGDLTDRALNAGYSGRLVFDGTRGAWYFNSSAASSTAGSILPNYQQPLTILANGSVGIGIGATAPAWPLDIKTPGYAVTARFFGQGGPTSNNTQIRFAGQKDGETWAVGTDLLATGTRDFHFWELPSSGVRFTIQAATGNVGIGTTNPLYPLSVNGTIEAKEVRVETGWADYVFNPNYRLKPLSEVAVYIKQNHHLPDIPSEAEVKEQGVSLGEMQAKLLAKIEELTLHMIRLENENQQLRNEVREVRERIAR